MHQHALVSPAYVLEQQRLHADPRGYGQGGRRWSAEVNATIWLHECRSLLDYGCGGGSLVASLKLASHCSDFREYDPAIESKNALPDPADMVVCTDVLEHVEPDKIEAVLDHVTLLTKRVLFVVISLVETAMARSDGRQAQTPPRPVPWWRGEFEALGFAVVRKLDIKPEWAVVLRRAE